MATPLEISMAVWYYGRVGDMPELIGIREDIAPAYQEARDDFLNRGLLIPSKRADYPAKYMAGPALECYVKALCAVPFPVQAWVIPQEEKGEGQ